jgi:hypothetical protein
MPAPVPDETIGIIDSPIIKARIKANVLFILSLSN